MTAERGETDASRHRSTHPMHTSSHGFEFSAETSLYGLRRSANRPQLVVRRGTVNLVSQAVEVGHWPAIPGKRAEVSIVALEESHMVTIGKMARFLVDTSSSTIVSQYAPNLPPMMQTTTLMSSPMALCLARKGNLALHAGAVEVDGRGLLLAAAGTGGKTTLAAAFHMAGHRVLSDDLVGVDPEGLVDPAVALLRMRLDAAMAVGHTLSDVVPRLDDGGKRFFEITEARRGDGAGVPSAGIVFLSWSDESDLSIEEVPASVAIQRLWPLSFYLQGTPGSAETFERLAKFVDLVPSFVLRRPRDFGKLQSTVERLETLLSSL